MKYRTYNTFPSNKRKWHNCVEQFMFLDYSFSQLFDEPLLMDVFHITSDPSSSVVVSLYV